ncbi:glutamate--tRNA ligase family protein [Akkermansia sp. JRP_AM1]
MISDDLASGKHQAPVTRFPPEPNGYLHIGHAKSICLNFGIAQEFPGARCHLRFDDTNPSKEDQEYVDSIQEDIRWLGFDWGTISFLPATCSISFTNAPSPSSTRDWPTWTNRRWRKYAPSAAT